MYIRILFKSNRFISNCTNIWKIAKQIKTIIHRAFLKKGNSQDPLRRLALWGIAFVLGDRKPEKTKDLFWDNQCTYYLTLVHIVKYPSLISNTPYLLSCEHIDIERCYRTSMHHGAQAARRRLPLYCPSLNIYETPHTCYHAAYIDVHTAAYPTYAVHICACAKKVWIPWNEGKRS